MVTRNTAAGIIAAILLTVLATLILAGCRRGRSFVPPPGVQVEAGTLPSVTVEAGARSVLLLRFRLLGVAAGATVETLRVVVRSAASFPLLNGLRLVEDRDDDGRFDPEADRFITALALDGAVAAGSLQRQLAADTSASFLVLGNVRPVAMGTRLTIELDPASIVLRDATGRPSPAAGDLVAGPSIDITDQLFAAAGVGILSGGAVEAALHLDPDPQPARVLVGGNVATSLRREAPGFYSFLLPAIPAGQASILLLDGSGRQLSEFRDALVVNHGAGPARFLDVSLTHLPQDHAFSQDAEVADVDGDGDPDLLIPSYAAQTDRLYLNDGHGRFTDASATHMPSVRADSVHLEPFDADGDGDVDLAVAVEGGRNRLYLNDGTGRFTDVTLEPGRFPATPDFSEDMRAGDLDGDGDLDLVIANLVDYRDARRGGQIRVYLNDGRGYFADATVGRLLATPTRTYDVNLGDLDGDGDLDLFAAGYGETDRIYQNNGSAFFTAASQLPANSSFHTSAVLGDIDGDGDLDVVAGTFQGQSNLYLNQGGLQFVDASPQLSVGAMSTYDVNLADLDGDRDLDLIFVNTHNPSVIVMNDGGGRFKPLDRTEFFTPDDPAYDVQVLDADGDGALDIFIAAWGNRQDTLYLAHEPPLPPPAKFPRLTRVEPNWGPPDGGTWVTLRGQGFAAGTTATIGGAALREVTVEDGRTMRGVVPPGVAGLAPITLGVPGAAEQTYRQGYTYEQPPAGAFRDATRETLGAEPTSTTAVAAGDLDGDGLPDLVFADLEVGARVRINTGGGKMRKVGFQSISASTNDLELVDLDGDAKLDLLLVDAAGPAWIFPGLGDGTFANGQRLTGPAFGGEEVATGDFDGDKDIDLVFAVFGKAVVLRNDGGMKFSALDNAGLVAESGKGVALGDVDGDGDLDLFVANFMQRTRLYLNSGAGSFREAVDALPDNTGDQTFSVALADVDGDGDLDAAIANGGAQVNRLFLNDGRGKFAEAPVGVFRPALGGGAHVIFGDVDGDGGPDLFSAHFWGDNHLYFADAGRLAERSGMLPNSPGGFAGAAFVDIDGDQDLDLVLAAFWGGSRILLNPRSVR